MDLTSNDSFLSLTHSIEDRGKNAAKESVGGSSTELVNSRNIQTPRNTKGKHVKHEQSNYGHCSENTSNSNDSKGQLSPNSSSNSFKSTKQSEGKSIVDNKTRTQLENLSSTVETSKKNERHLNENVGTVKANPKVSKNRDNENKSVKGAQYQHKNVANHQQLKLQKEEAQDVNVKIPKQVEEHNVKSSGTKSKIVTSSPVKISVPTEEVPTNDTTGLQEPQIFNKELVSQNNLFPISVTR